MSRAARPGFCLAAVLAFAGTAGAQSVEPALAELLAASDLFARAPAEFRTEIELRPVGAREGGRLELYRKGADRELVRFLAPKEVGKFLLRRGDELYLLAPGSRRPVRLASSHRVYGAAIHDLVGMDLVRDYRIERAAEAAGVVTFDLVASAPGAAAPRLRWVVSRETGRPLRSELRSSQGKAMRVIEFRSWRDAERGVPEQLRVSDLLSGRTALDVRFVDFEAAPVDERLFELEDGSARAALSAPPS